MEYPKEQSHRQECRIQATWGSSILEAAQEEISVLENKVQVALRTEDDDHRPSRVDYEACCRESQVLVDLAGNRRYSPTDQDREGSKYSRLLATTRRKVLAQFLMDAQDRLLNNVMARGLGVMAQLNQSDYVEYLEDTCADMRYESKNKHRLQ